MASWDQCDKEEREFMINGVWVTAYLCRKHRVLQIERVDLTGFYSAGYQDLSSSKPFWKLIAVIVGIMILAMGILYLIAHVL